jgi:predicted transcriptional regulator
MSERRPTRVNVLLGEEHAAKLFGLAERTHVNPGTLARSMLTTALDQADPDAATITALLDAVPGAFERAQEGLADVRTGRVVSLDEI